MSNFAVRFFIREIFDMVGVSFDVLKKPIAYFLLRTMLILFLWNSFVLNLSISKPIGLTQALVLSILCAVLVGPRSMCNSDHQKREADEEEECSTLDKSRSGCEDDVLFMGFYQMKNHKLRDPVSYDYIKRAFLVILMQDMQSKMPLPENEVDEDPRRPGYTMNNYEQTFNAVRNATPEQLDRLVRGLGYEFPLLMRLTKNEPFPKS